jgi:hypothetical protein
MSRGLSLRTEGSKVRIVNSNPNSLSNLYQKSYNYLVTKTRSVLYFQENLMLTYINLLQTNLIIPNTLIVIPGNALLCLFGFSILSLYTIIFTGISRWSFWWGFLGNITYLQMIIFLLASFSMGFVISTINNMIRVSIIRDHYLVDKILDVRIKRNESFSN